MDIIWNHDRLLDLLRCFHLFTKVRVGFFDIDGTEILAWPEERSEFCTIIRAGRRGDEACRKCDKAAFLSASRHKEPYIYRCHAGLTEMIVPITNPLEEQVAYLMAGQIRPSTDSAKETWDAVRPLVAGFTADNARLEKSCRKLPVLKMEKTRACGCILKALAASVWLDNYIRMQSEPLSARVEAYIKNNFDKELSLLRIAAEFGVGKTTLCKTVKNDLNCTVTELIRYIRIEEAKALIQGSEKPIARIAEQAGIMDYNYFSKVFKEETGVTPSVFRKLCEKEKMYGGGSSIHPKPASS
jgi:AraC-like DNA-binding protein